MPNNFTNMKLYFNYFWLFNFKIKLRWSDYKQYGVVNEISTLMGLFFSVALPLLANSIVLTPPKAYRGL